ncbi:HNH endonuclease [Streptomyces sp. WZ-12]|uniref:HNH endonuclease n=1 Tax=Streptomyces sp. WZ-12 TaxID=3030210 RepID=UPI003159826E
MCQRPGKVEVHHAKSLRSLQRDGDTSSDWVKLMVERRRKALVVCDECHGRIHQRTPHVTPAQ